MGRPDARLDNRLRAWSRLVSSIYDQSHICAKQLAEPEVREACCEVGYAGCRTHSPVPLSILGKAGGCAGSHMLHSETSVANPETLAMCLNTWEGWWPCWVPHAVLHSPQRLLPLLLGQPPQRYHAPLHRWAEQSSLCVQGSERVPESR